MKKANSETSDLAALRRKAQKKLKEQTERLQELSQQDTKRLITELGTHQIELEMQNEELRRAERELGASRDRYADLYDFAPVGYFTIDEQGMICEINQSGADLLELGKRLLLNKSFTSFLLDMSDQRIFRAHCDDAFLKQTRQSCEVRLKGKDGPPLYVQLQSIAAGTIEDKAGSLRMTVIDINERKRAEEELGKSRELLHSVIEGTSDAIYVKDLKGRYLLFNTASEGITGKNSAEVLGKDDTVLFRPEEAKMVMAGDRAVIKAGTRQTYEEVVTTASGEKRTYLSTKGPLFDNDGRLAGLFGIARDITERKKAQEELQSTHAELERQACELEAVNRELEAFSYTVSHDLKTPLRSIGGFAGALLEDCPDKLDATCRDYLSRINAATLRMNQLIDAMLKMAKSTRGEMHENVVNFSSLAKVIAHDLKKRDPERQVEFVIVDNMKVKGDATMMEVMLQNLMDNAWKFTSTHQTARIEFGVDERDGKTVYYVRDDGAGFNMQYADKLFMPFQRLHKDSEFPGIGIGLAIAHRIITRHGGRIWAEGEIEKGATIFFTVA